VAVDQFAVKRAVVGVVHDQLALAGATDRYATRRASSSVSHDIGACRPGTATSQSPHGSR